MGKGSRNRDNRVEDTQVTETTAPKLSKKQLIRIQQKKAKQKKIITWVATAAIAVALVAAIIFMSIPATPDLEGSVDGLDCSNLRLFLLFSLNRHLHSCKQLLANLS